MIKIFEKIYNTDKYGYTKYEPRTDSKFKRLIQKPINTLTTDEVAYIFAIHWMWYMYEAKWYDGVEDCLSDTEFDMNDFDECAEWLHSFDFPLTVYRALRKNENTDNINGLSWTVNPNIFKEINSIFRNCDKIVTAEIINPNIIDSELTISNFMFYTGSKGRQSNYNFYGEYEITLKKRYKTSDLTNVEIFDKNG